MTQSYIKRKRFESKLNAVALFEILGEALQGSQKEKVKDGNDIMRAMGAKFK